MWQPNRPQWLVIWIVAIVLILSWPGEGGSLAVKAVRWLADPRHELPVMPDPLPKEAPVPRVTLSRAAIVSARALMIAITGDEKKAVLERAIEEGASSQLPVGRVLADVELPVDIHWSAS